MALVSPFHWGRLTVYMVCLLLGLWMVTLGYYDSWYHSAPEIHKSIGILLFYYFDSAWYGVGSLRLLKLYQVIACWHALVLILHICFIFNLIFILISGYLISTADGQVYICIWLVFCPPFLQGSRASGFSGWYSSLFAWSVFYYRYYMLLAL